MIGKGANQIERARNFEDLGNLGDPERWGGVGAAELQIPTGVASNQTIYTPQIVRAQCADLVARSWDVLVFWTIWDDQANDNIDLTLETTIGSGQASGTGEIVIFPPGLFAALSNWATRIVTGRANGATTIFQPLPATAIAARGRLNVQATGIDPAHVVRAQLAVMLAPRSVR